MILAILILFALLEVALGAGVLAGGESSSHQMLGINLIGFGILTIGMAGILSELRNALREAAKERQAALEERQARAALNLKQRLGTISSRDRQQRQIERADIPISERRLKLRLS
jgi:hypothetical protein